MSKLTSADNAANIADAYERHHEELMAYFTSRGHRYTEAEDIVQETFVRLMTVELDTTRSVRGLIYRMAKNIAIDIRRHAARSASYAAVSVQDINLNAEHVAYDGECVYDLVEEAEVSDLVLSMIDEQPDDTREIVQLYYFGGMTYLEVSQQTGVSVTTCKDRVAKVLGILRERMQVAA